MSLFATDDRHRIGAFIVHQVWLLPGVGVFLRISAAIGADTPSFPSIAGKYPVANWFEREVMDFFGLVAEGHPNPVRVALHDDWPDGVWPLRKDFPLRGHFSRAEQTRQALAANPEAHYSLAELSIAAAYDELPEDMKDRLAHGERGKVQ